MSRKSRETILKRVREQKRREKAALKRERRLARKQGKNLDEDEEFEVLDGPAPTSDDTEEETVDNPIEEVFSGEPPAEKTPDQP